MLSAIVNACKSFFHRIKETIKQFTKPATAVLPTGTMSYITRNWPSFNNFGQALAPFHDISICSRNMIASKVTTNSFNNYKSTWM
jgi:hypothetical protein